MSLMGRPTPKKERGREKGSAGLALQLQSMLISESLGHHDSEIMDGSWIRRGDAGAVGVVVAGRQGANPAAVPHPIKTLQYLLRARDHTVAVDGVFGPKTEAAVK